MCSLSELSLVLTVSSLARIGTSVAYDVSLCGFAFKSFVLLLIETVVRFSSRNHSTNLDNALINKTKSLTGCCDSEGLLDSFLSLSSLSLRFCSLSARLLVLVVCGLSVVLVLVVTAVVVELPSSMDFFSLSFKALG